MNDAANTATLLVVTRDHSHVIGRFVSLMDAIHCAQSSRKPCDVHAPSGAIAWAWEQRP